MSTHIFITSNWFSLIDLQRKCKKLKSQNPNNMKTVFFLLITGLLMPSFLMAQVKPINKTKAQLQIKTVQTNVTDNKQQIHKLYENTDHVITNAVSSVSLLKTSASKTNPDYNVKITQVQKNPVQIPNPYNSENGIVLNALNPSEPFTGSNMYISGAMLNADLINKIKNGSSTDIEIASTAHQFDNVLYANFKNLPGSNHLYLITLAMYLSDNDYEISIGKSFNNLEVTPVNKFVYNPDLHTYQLLLMINPDNYNQLYVLVRSVIKSEYLTVMNHFYYIQLVQLD
jgi:hypothetical protein